MNGGYVHAAAQATSGARRTGLLLLGLAVTAVSAAQPAPWHLDGWQARAVVTIAEAEPGADTAGVKILCQGRAKSDGSDYRVLDAAGNALPFQLVYHDAQRYSLISFRAADPRINYFVYFDNPDAPPPSAQVVAGPTPGAGPPGAAWVPRQGLVYATIERPEGDNPKTVDEMAAMIAASGSQFGARYQRHIADGYNPFGPSDMYISLYRGWLDVPESGTYAFCTASNEASFSFLDGQELIHWPGRHTAERGERGEKNVEVELAAGLHYVEYYHEEVYLQQMAFLGWRTPNTEDPGYAAIPESAFPRPHAAQAASYETPAGRLLCFEPQVADSVWPEERHEGQYTRCVFEAVHAPQDTAIEWDFGDGQTAAGAKAGHVYLVPGTYVVTARDTRSGQSARWPLLVYEIQHLTGDSSEGAPADYLALARTYDRDKLNAEQLKELAHLLSENEALEESLAAGREFIERFETSHPEWVPQVRRLMAACALRRGEAGVDEAIANYEAALEAEASPALKLDALGQLIRLAGVERGLLEKAEELLDRIEATAEGAGLEAETIAAYRGAIIAAGDARLWNGRADDALALYHKAEVLTANPIPPQVRAARTGAYPDTIRQFLVEDNLGAALDVVRRWEQTFPTEKYKGQTLFWRGKILALRGRRQDAVRHLSLSVRLAVGADFETEARWLLAQSLEELDRIDEARRELVKLVAIGMKDAVTEQARERLESMGRNEGTGNE